MTAYSAASGIGLWRTDVHTASLAQLPRYDPHPMDKIGKAWVRAKRIDAGKPGSDPDQVSPDPAGCFEPTKSRIEIAKVSSAFAMEQIKYTTALPLDFAREGTAAPRVTDGVARR